MREWVAGIVGENMATGVMLVLVTLAIVIAFVVVLAIFRGFSGGGIRGTNRSRQARLAVMDAAVVDSKRRLVLIRRDDVEHLVMIGGPSDVVVEQNIRRNMQEKPVAARPQMRPVPKPAQPAQAAPAAPAAPARPAPAKAAPSNAAPAKPAAAKPAPAPQAPAAPVRKPAPAAPAAVNAIQGTVKKVVAVAAPAVAATKVATASPPQPAPPAPAPAAAPAPAVSAAPPPPAPVKASVAAPEPVKATAIEPPTPAATKNQLESFEDVLAMDKGKTLVPDADATSNSLANEMDELLSEITGSSKSTT